MWSSSNPNYWRSIPGPIETIIKSGCFIGDNKKNPERVFGSPVGVSYDDHFLVSPLSHFTSLKIKGFVVGQFAVGRNNIFSLHLMKGFVKNYVVSMNNRKRIKFNKIFKRHEVEFNSRFCTTFSTDFWFRLELFWKIWPWRAQFGHSPVSAKMAMYFS